MLPGVIVSNFDLVVFDPPPPAGVLEEMAEIDRSAAAELGRKYASEPWSAESFARSLPHKWTLSRYCVESRTGKICGFWIASMAVAGIVHTHRVAISRDARARGVGRALFADVREAAREAGGAEMTLFLSPLNREARAFYERLGFRKLTGGELSSVLARTNRTGSVRRDTVRIGDDDLNLMWRYVEMREGA